MSSQVHQFSQVPKAQIQRSSFDRSSGLKTTFDAGLLVPVFVDEALPGDTFNLKTAMFGRLATPIHPVMDNMYLDTFFFAVPHRLVWDNWEKFCGAQTDPGDSIDFVIPTVNMTAANAASGVGQLGDYFGLPTNAYASGFNANVLPFRAYNLIYNEWFRDQNLQDSLTVQTGDGPDSTTLYQVRRRGKRHDYFTSALPFPQKGESIDIPLGTVAPVVSQGGSPNAPLWEDSGGIVLGAMQTAAGAPGNVTTPNAVGGSGFMFWNDPQLEADLTNATAATVNQLRQAFQIQKLQERDARGGTRYVELIKAHFGVTSPDARLQRPEYLGGASQPINVQPVPQTSETAATPQGNLSAYGTVSASGNGFTKSFTEHSIIIGLASLRADLTYQQGLDRMWSRSTRYDFFWPALANIGEQAVFNQEIFAQGTSADTEVFGYQERFAEYRYKPSRISGLFRSEASASLDSWHLSQDFQSLPALNDSFIQDNPPIDRVIAVQDEPHLIADFHFGLRCARPMPLYGVPGNMDRF